MTTTEQSFLDLDSVDTVLYHGSCPDGYGSAFIVWYYYKKIHGINRANAIKYIPCYYNNKISNESFDGLRDKNILMCDFSYKYNQLMYILSIAKAFMILDHHKTAEQDLENIPDHIKKFNMEKSGVGITWEVFFPNEPIPTFLKYIQDRDIWSEKYHETTPFVAYFYEQSFDFELWEQYLVESKITYAIDVGFKYLEYQNILIKKIIKKTAIVIQDINNKYQVVLYSNSPELKSDIGSKMLKAYPIGDFSCVWDNILHYDKDNNVSLEKTSISLRSTNDRTDISSIAAQFGGGGHRNASGCTINGFVSRLPFTIIDDCNLLHMLMHDRKGKIGVSKGKISMLNEKQKYVLYKLSKEEYIKYRSTKYFDLIARKNKDCAYIVFEKPSELVDIDPVTKEVIPVKKYRMHYNDKSITNAEKKLSFLACGAGVTVLKFASSKDFHVIYAEKNASGLDHNGSNSSGNSSNSDIEN